MVQACQAQKGQLQNETQLIKILINANKENQIQISLLIQMNSMLTLQTSFFWSFDLFISVISRGSPYFLRTPAL